MDARQLHILINKTRIKKFSVEFDEDGVRLVYSTIGICTQTGKEVADHTSWAGGGYNDFEITSDMTNLLMAAGCLLHQRAEQHLMGLHGLIDVPKQTPSEVSVPF